MDFENFLDILNGKKKEETQFFVTERRNMWIVEDNKGRSAIGKTLEEAKANFINATNKEYEALKERVERDAAESRRKHRELWNY